VFFVALPATELACCAAAGFKFLPALLARNPSAYLVLYLVLVLFPVSQTTCVAAILLAVASVFFAVLEPPSAVRANWIGFTRTHAVCAIYRPVVILLLAFRAAELLPVSSPEFLPEPAPAIRAALFRLLPVRCQPPQMYLLPVVGNPARVAAVQALRSSFFVALLDKCPAAVLAHAFVLLVHMCIPPVPSV
jgi:hypothetical protein